MCKSLGSSCSSTIVRPTHHTYGIRSTAAAYVSSWPATACRFLVLGMTIQLLFLESDVLLVPVVILLCCTLAVGPHRSKHALASDKRETKYVTSVFSSGTDTCISRHIAIRCSRVQTASQEERGLTRGAVNGVVNGELIGANDRYV